MEIFHVSSLLCFIIFLPFIHSLSTIAISETANQTLICAIESNSFLNCTNFPQRTQIPFNFPFPISGIVAGNGFLCALTSFYSSSSSSSSIMVCWRFLNIQNNMTFSRVYRGPVLTELASGNSKICSLLNNSNSLECWQWHNFNHTDTIFNSNLAVGDDFVCGLMNSGQIGCVGSDTNVTQHVPSGNFTVLAAGFRYACGISFNGSLECWGNMIGEKPKGEFIGLALGENRGCALRANETVTCWGENGFDVPVALKEESFIGLEAKRNLFCGIRVSDYAVLCWGNSDFDLNSLVFDRVVPGPCRSRSECVCGPLPNFGEYCNHGLVICQPCVEDGALNRPPSVSPQPVSPGPLATPSLRVGRNGKWDGKMVVLLVVGCVGSLSLLLVLACILYFRYCKDRGSSRIHDSGRLEEGGSSRHSGQITVAQRATTRVLQKRPSHLISLGGHLEEFSLQLLLKLTDNFAEDYKIGTGSFGSVYCATLDDGREVAIKRAEASTSSSYAGVTKRGLEDKDSAFLNELTFLSRLNHKNLVRLLGYCDDSNELVLVYEHMSNATLFHHLHRLQSSPLMSWPKRIKVALDAARGIEYLHEFAVPHIIHRDIKSSNILLDSTWNAKVSDFGLSLMGPPDDESHILLHAAGTMGYMDPEYYRSQVLTTKSDVYSFGVLLLELLSGCKAIHKNENGVPRNVVDYVIPYIIHDEIHRVLDRRVPPPTPFEIEAVAYVGYLAADCVMPEGRDRPTMTEVVNSLNRALEACLAPTDLSRSTTDSSISG